MASKDRVIIGTITELKREKSSRMGNPAWTVTLQNEETGETETYRTQADVGWSYSAGNPAYRAPARLRFILTPAGRIRWAELLNV